LHARASSIQPEPTAISFFMRGSNFRQTRRARALRSSMFQRGQTTVSSPTDRCLRHGSPPKTTTETCLAMAMPSIKNAVFTVN